MSIHHRLAGKITTLCLAPAFMLSTLNAMDLKQNLDQGERLEITDANAPLPSRLIQTSGRLGSNNSYDADYLQAGLHFRTATELTLPTNINIDNLNTSHVIGVHGKDSIVRYTGRWQANGGSSFPHLTLTEGGRFIFTAESSMNLVMDGAFFTRQLWVHGDGSGVLELEAGFVADHSVNEPLANALGTLRLGGVTLHTHDTGSMPQNTRPDGRGGHYQNGHIVFERVPGNRWIVDSTNHYYAAQLDFDTDATLEIRSSLTHIGNRRIAMPVGPGGYFISTGAFRTTSANVTITKTGPGMLALDGEQSYRSGSQLVLEEGLTRMSGDPGLGRDNFAHGDAGAVLKIRARNAAGIQFSSPLSRLQRIDLEDQSRLWLDEGCQLQVSEGLHIGANAQADLRGTVSGRLRVQGQMSTIATQPLRVEALDLSGTWAIAIGGQVPDEPLLTVTASAELKQLPEITFSDRKQVPAGDIMLLEAGNLQADVDGSPRPSGDGRYTYILRKDGNRLIMNAITPIKE